jgi:hypothetical protein
VTVQHRPHGSGSWRTLATVKTDARGYWSLTRHLKRGTAYRFRSGSAISSTVRR